MPVMTITFGSDLSLDFDVESTPIANLWLERMQERHQWPLDDPKRFYGFDDPAVERERAEQKLLESIKIINAYQPIIERPWTSIDDQDQLNYLHSIFERWHGLLDKQQMAWWEAAPDNVRRALADLNILVHRAESVIRGNNPRFICTWFGMPKNYQLSPDMMIKHGTIAYQFGGVYLNYVEIGKTLEDLSIDDDRWISDHAFQPFLRYSADFCVRFHDGMADIARVYRYFEHHRKFFESKGIYEFDDYRVMPRRYRVAQLRLDRSRESLLQAIRDRQHVTDIYIA